MAEFDVDCSGLKMICNGKVIREDVLLSSQNIKVSQPFKFVISLYPNFLLFPCTNEKSAYMAFIPHNHYQILYLYFSVFQLVSTNCFSYFIQDFIVFDTVFFKLIIKMMILIFGIVLSNLIIMS